MSPPEVIKRVMGSILLDLGELPPGIWSRRGTAITGRNERDRTRAQPPRDVRTVISPPLEPMETVLAALAELQAGDRLRMLHRREPFPLYEHLRRMGYERETTENTTCGEVGFAILSWHRDATPPG